MQNITEPLRLAIGSHVAGSGKGCAMNVVSWESGESTISDLPACADPFLARVVQRVNDTYCTHVTEGLLCPPCSVEVLALAHRTVGTALDMKPAQRARVYVEIAVEEAESVLHLTTGDAPRRAVALVRRFLAGEDTSASDLRAAYTAAYAANAAANAAAAAAANAAANAAVGADAYAYTAAYAANAAVGADAYAYTAAAADAAVGADAYAYTAAAADAADAAAVGAYAYTAAADAADAAADDRLARAHRIIDRFEKLTGIHATPVQPEVATRAIAQMQAVTS